MAGLCEGYMVIEVGMEDMEGRMRWGDCKVLRGLCRERVGRSATQGY